MSRTGQRRRQLLRVPLGCEGLETRRLMSAGSMVSPLLVDPIAYPAIHPNTPVMPFATPTKKASFIDPTVWIRNGHSVIVSYQSYVAPSRRSTAAAGRHQDRRRLGRPRHGHDRGESPSAVPLPEALIGNQVVIGYGGEDPGPEHDRRLRWHGRADRDRRPGGHRRRDDRARRDRLAAGPGRAGRDRAVGYRVLPGMDVTTDAEASNPKLGMVVKVTSSDTSAVATHGQHRAGRGLHAALPGQLGHRGQSRRQPRDRGRL